MLVSVAPDSGNIELLDCSRPHDVRLKIRPDNAAAFRQWFYFRCVGVNGAPIRLRILNAGTCTYPKGWEGYSATASYDGVLWYRVPTRYQDGELWIEHTPKRNVVDYAYFAPYPYERRLARIDWLKSLPVQGSSGFQRIETLGKTPDGHPMQVLVFGAGPVPIWILARQHPGEVMAEWFAEGLVDRLVAGGAGEGDPVVRRILERATVRIVPCMNPDGGRRGNHRTNARGIDLNGTWHSPDRVDAPEVGLVLDRMDEVGVALALDIHGDEEIPYNFVSGGEGTPSWDPRRAALKQRFVEAWIQANPELQTLHGYPAPTPGDADLTVCSQQIAERFGCLALTVEQPFKDNADRPDPILGWSSSRSKKLGASALEPIDASLEDLR